MTERDRERRKRREAGGRGGRGGGGRRGRTGDSRGGRTGSGEPAEEGFRPAGLAPLNLILLGAAVVCLVAGYVLLDRGSITAAPVLLVLGYAVLIPAGLLIGSRARGKEGDDAAAPGAPRGGGRAEKRAP